MKAVNLTFAALTSADKDSIVQHLQGNTEVESVILDSTQLGDPTLASIIEVLPESVTFLSLSDCGAGRSCLSSLANSVKQNRLRRLTFLSLKSNKISDASADDLGCLVKTLSDLKDLDLSWNELGSVAVTAIFKAISSHPSLRSLSLANVDFAQRADVYEQKSLSKLLHNNTSIHTLNFDPITEVFLPFTVRNRLSLHLQEQPPDRYSFQEVLTRVRDGFLHLTEIRDYKTQGGVWIQWHQVDGSSKPQFVYSSVSDYNQPGDGDVPGFMLLTEEYFEGVFTLDLEWTTIFTTPTRISKTLSGHRPQSWKVIYVLLQGFFLSKNHKLQFHPVELAAILKRIHDDTAFKEYFASAFITDYCSDVVAESDKEANLTKDELATCTTFFNSINKVRSSKNEPVIEHLDHFPIQDLSFFPAAVSAFTERNRSAIHTEVRQLLTLTSDEQLLTAPAKKEYRIAQKYAEYARTYL
eukprot:TRINITY_DN10846_c0_g1_i1.p2 TRINITY_DN10846_c0_g1~~TRINITY_DN10846_c0_g1_i1.p2  ORF type:complete len:468 (-),score=31.58 TRINITY_DN10846_c0_g1_i1:671-2074(-)